MNLAIFGSGEFTPSVVCIDEYIIRHFSPTNVAVIPLAAGAESDASKWLDMAVGHYKTLDLPVIEVPIYNGEDANNPDLAGKVKKADWIFFSGGDPGYLLRALKGSLLWDNVVKRQAQGSLLAGSSAGAMVMGSYVLSSPFRAMFGSGETNWD